MDIVFIQKGTDGTTLYLEIKDQDDEEFNAFSEVVDQAEGLLSDDNIHELAVEILPDNSAAQQQLAAQPADVTSAAPQAAPAAGPPNDLMGKLQQLKQMKQAGLLTEE